MMTRDILRHVVEQIENFTVVGTAGDAESGLQQAVRLSPDAILLDLILPDCFGFELFRKIKALLPSVRIILVSGDDDKESLKTANELGAAGYITKPFKYNTLHHTLLNLISPCVQEESRQGLSA